MKKENIFLTLVIPGPKHPGKNLDVYMEPLYDDLQLLWNEGVLVYNRSVCSTLRVRACYFYSISDLPALGMVSGHSTHGKFACPVCLRTVSAVWLVNGWKYCWFDCHRQFLPIDKIRKVGAGRGRPNLFEWFRSLVSSRSSKTY